ncbi:MFS transporter [Nakamurella lactea]|uniref:MFS transporter n=1 Tax=Nakamurella lactea TaxID=459515 RepID=UPI0004141E67|nr:MFS transporter [Nakamurella lactea]
MRNQSGPARPAPAARRTLRRARGGAAFCFAAQGLVFASVLTHLPALKDRWTLDDLAVTGLMFAVAVLAGAGSALAGLLAARVGSAVTLRSGLLLAAAGLTVVGVAPALWVLLAGLAGYGLAVGLIDAGTNMQAVALEAEYGRSILTSFHAAWSVGGIFGALATAGTAALHWSLPAALLPLVVVPLLAAAAPLLSSAPGSGTAVAGAAGDSTGRVALVPIPWRPLAVLGAALVLFYVADSAASSWSSIYLRDVLAASAAVAPLAFGAYQAASLCSRLSGDLLVRRYGAVAVVRSAAGVGVAGLVLVVTAPGPAPAIVGFAVLGAGVAVVAPLTFAAAGRLAGPGPDRRRVDALVARLNQFNYLGFVLGGVLTGLVSSAGSLRWGFVVPLVGIAAILPLAGAFATPVAAPSAASSAES